MRTQRYQVVVVYTPVVFFFPRAGEEVSSTDILLVTVWAADRQLDL